MHRHSWKQFGRVKVNSKRNGCVRGLSRRILTTKKRNSVCLHQVSNVIATYLTRDSSNATCVSTNQETGRRTNRVHTKLRTERNKELDLKAQLQPTPEARAEDKNLGQASVFMDESCLMILMLALLYVRKLDQSCHGKFRKRQCNYGG